LGGVLGCESSGFRAGVFNHSVLLSLGGGQRGGEPVLPPTETPPSGKQWASGNEYGCY